MPNQLTSKESIARAVMEQAIDEVTKMGVSVYVCYGDSEMDLHIEDASYFDVREQIQRKCSGPCGRTLRFEKSVVKTKIQRCKECGTETEWRIV